MSVLLKGVAGAGLLTGLLAVAALADWMLNDGRVGAVLTGRDSLVAACTPALVRRLSDEGFSPQDIELDRPSAGGWWGRARSLDAEFTFEDGAAETRVDGVMSCFVGPTDVRVVVRTNARPVRAG